MLNDKNVTFYKKNQQMFVVSIQQLKIMPNSIVIVKDVLSTSEEEKIMSDCPELFVYQYYRSECLLKSPAHSECYNSQMSLVY